MNITQYKQIHKEFNIYILFVVSLVSLQLICNLIIGVEVKIYSFAITASALFYALSFTLSDLVAEIYGFEKAVRATVYNIYSQIIFCGIAFVVVHFLEVNFAGEGAQSVNYFYNLIAREFFSSTLSLIAGKTANDLLIVYLGRKLLWRMFALRTIFCTICGEVVMLQIDYNITFFGHKSPLHIQQLILAAMSYKLIAAVLLAYPATYVATQLKKKVSLTVPQRAGNRPSFLLSFFRAFKLW